MVLHGPKRHQGAPRQASKFRTTINAHQPRTSLASGLICCTSKLPVPTDPHPSETGRRERLSRQLCVAQSEVASLGTQLQLRRRVPDDSKIAESATGLRAGHSGHPCLSWHCGLQAARGRQRLHHAGRSSSSPTKGTNSLEGGARSRNGCHKTAILPPQPPPPIISIDYTMIACCLAIDSFLAWCRMDLVCKEVQMGQNDPAIRVPIAGTSARAATDAKLSVWVFPTLVLSTLHVGVPILSLR